MSNKWITKVKKKKEQNTVLAFKLLFVISVRDEEDQYGPFLIAAVDFHSAIRKVCQHLKEKMLFRSPSLISSHRIDAKDIELNVPKSISSPQESNPWKTEVVFNKTTNTFDIDVYMGDSKRAMKEAHDKANKFRFSDSGKKRNSRKT